MSSSNFAGEKQRVAHSAASSMQSALEQKRVAMAKVAAAINNGNYKPATPKKSPVKAVKAKKPRYESDDDFVVENSEEDEFLSDEEEGGPPKSKKRKAISEFSEDEDFDSPVKKPKPRTISESDSDDGWMSKKPAGKLMKTRVSEKKEPKKKKIIVSSDEESDFDGEEEDTEKPKSPKKSTNLLKKTIKNAEKEKKKRKEGKGSDGSWAGSDEEEEFESTPDEDSEGDSDDGKKRRRSETAIQRKAREYFNSIKKDELENVPKMNPKILGVILQQRPFDDFEAMEEAICAVSRGSVMIESYMETMQNRNILQNVLEDCKSHAESVERGFSTLAERSYKPNILNKNMELHDYQKTGLNWLIMMHEKGLNCILADEMGLGKTIQVIAFLAYLKETQAVGPQLIVVPSSTLENWLNEFANWCPEIKVLTYYGSQEMRKDLRYKAKKKKEMTDVILTTYNMVGSKNDDRKFFKNYKMNYVIYDEGHMLKNCGTERYKNLMKIKGKHKILLTGTPLQNNLIELISLMYFTMTKIFTKYCQDIVQLLQHFKQQGSAMEAKTTSDLYQRDRIEQAKQILQPYILRRLKANVLTSLPNKFETVLEVDMIADQEELYEHTLELCRNLDGDTNNAYGALMRLRQAANHPLLRRVQYEDKQVDKIAKILVSKEKSYEKKQWEGVADEISFYSDFQIHQLCEKFHCLRKYLLSEDLAMKSGKFQKLDELLPVIKKKGDKVLIFSQFTTMLDILEVYMNNRGHKFKRLDGQTPVMERQEMINEYNGSSDLFVFLLSTRAGGLGINLTSANHIIIHDIDFNPYNDKQAEDRCHRMGQKKDVFVTKLISKGTVEVGIHLVAKKKLQLEKQVTTGIKGQEDENGDGEETRDSSDSKEEKIDKDTLNKLLKSAMKRKSLSEADDIDKMGKASVEEIANRYLNKKEEKKEVVEIVDRCIQKGYDYEKMKDRVLNAVADAHKAHKIISAVCEEFPQLRKRTRFEESKEDKKDVKRERFSENTREKENGDRDNRDKDRGDRSRDSRRESRRDEADGKEREREARRKLTQKMHDRQKTEEVVQTQSHSTGTPVTEEHLRAKELMYKAQQEIEERKKALGLAAVSVAPGQMPATVNVKKIALQPKEAQMFMNFSMEKKSRVEELKAKLSKVPTSIQNLVNKQPVMTPLPAEVAKPLSKQVVKEEVKPEEALVEFLDPRIDARSSERKKRAFNFHQPGQHIQEANKQRAQAKLNKLQQEVSAAAASTGISSAVKLAMVTPKSKKADEIPDIEWWDAVVLDRPNYDEIPDGKDEDRYAETVSDLVEHPISLPPPTEPLAPTFLKVYLTTKERKKIRRQNRKEMQKEQTEKIRLGLMKPPEPKVKISNLMRVLGSDAIQDPTKMEAHVKKQMAERVKKHEQANAERKLTAEQKAAKKTKKISEDTSIAVHVSVYRIKSLMNPAHKFKVEKNAKQLQMTGVIMLHRALNVVVVEGGPKQQKFYKNLLLNRIKWSDEIIGQKKAAKDDEPGERNSCQLIWEGVVKRRAFRDFQIVTATLDKQAREYFEKHAVAQYWDLSYSTTVLLEGQDPLPI